MERTLVGEPPLPHWLLLCLGTACPTPSTLSLSWPASATTRRVRWHHHLIIPPAAASTTIDAGDLTFP